VKSRGNVFERLPDEATLATDFSSCFPGPVARAKNGKKTKIDEIVKSKKYSLSLDGRGSG